MAVMRLARTVLTGSLALATLAACGGDPYADYCEAVKSHQERLSRTLGEGGPQALLEALPTFEELEGEAPDDVADDWAVLTKALTELRKALDAAGVDPADYDPDRPPSGVTRAEQERIAAAATAVGSERTQQALAAVDQQARDVCHTPLTV
jgi:hypothetical protein